MFNQFPLSMGYTENRSIFYRHINKLYIIILIYRVLFFEHQPLELIKGVDDYIETFNN